MNVMFPILAINQLNAQNLLLL